MLTVNQKSTLIQILAKTDAIWCPFRFSGSDSCRAAAAVREKRRDFDSRGVQLIVAGSGAARLAGERQLQLMATDGLITIFRRRKRVGVALTNKGDDVARAMTAGYLASESLNFLALVEKVKSTYVDQVKNHFVLEADLLGRDYDEIESSHLVAFEHISLPLLCRRWLESWSDGGGAVGYRTTESGCLALAAGEPKTGPLPKYDADAADEYDLLFSAALDDRDSWEPSKPGHIAMPLGNGSWPRKTGEPKYEFIFEETDRLKNMNTATGD